MRERMARESIDEAEAKWLTGRVDEDGILDDNERALLTFIKQNSTQVHPSLNELLAGPACDG